MSNIKNTGLLMLDSTLSGTNEDELNLRMLLHKYVLSRWYLYAFCCFIFGVLAYVYVKQQQPVYEISSKLLIKKGGNDYSSQEDWLNRSLKFSTVSENVIDEMEILSSFAIMHSVVQSLELDIRYFWTDKLSTIDHYKDFPIKIGYYNLKPIEKTSFVVRPISENTFEFSQDEQGGVYEYGQPFSNQFGTFCIDKNGIVPLKSDSVMNIAFINTKALAESFLENLSVTFTDSKNKSSILKLTFKDIIPQRGEDIVNAIIEKYQNIKYEENNALAVNTLNLINGRLVDISQELQAVENSMEQYKVDNNTFQNPADLNIILQNISQLTQEENDLAIQINIINSMKKGLDQSSGEFELIPVNLSLINEQIQQLIQPYNELVLKRKQLLLTGQPSNPIVQSVNQDLLSIKPSIITALNNMQTDLQLKLDAVEKQQLAFQQRLKNMPRNERFLTDRSRNKGITEDLYVYLLKKKEETALALVNSYTASNVIDPPRSSLDPVGPNSSKIYLGGMMAGFAFPFLFILLMDVVRDSIQTEEEIKKLLPDSHIMGMICQNKGKERQVVLRQRRALIAENFRALRTKIQFHFRSKQKSIMVTSSTSSEGKTFVAMNLAVSYALAKKKTVIIDFDLHKPDLMNYMETVAEVGLSDFLTGASTIEEVIQPSDVTPMLDYLASGPVPLNPNEIITESKLKELFTYLNANYDIVIVDTPPIGIISDAMLLNKYITHSLYVIRSGFTKKGMIEKANQLMEKKILVNPSIVLNGVKKDNLYGYGYGKYSKYAV